MEGTKKIKLMLFHQYSWNSEVGTTWISLISWHHKTSSIYSYCYRNRVLWIIADYLPQYCGALTRMTTKERTSRNLKPQVFPFPNTLLMLLCLEKKDFLLITFLQLLWGYYDGLCTSLPPSVSLFAASKLKNFYNQHFRWIRLKAQLDFFTR